MSVVIPPVLDHVVINVRGTLDEASTQWRKLGFALTERGHHSLGTSNHLSIFQENYLELLGLEPENEDKRPDIVNGPQGLIGLVFKTTDADQVFKEIQGTGLSVEEPKSFHRPVRLAAGVHEARFRTVHLGKDLVKNGRTFFCDHQTPELVWRDEWQTHPNGVTNVRGFVVTSAEPASTADIYQRLFGPQLVLESIEGGVAFHAGRADVQFITPAVAETRFGPVAKTEDGSERRVALIVETRSLDALRAILRGNRVPFVEQADRSVVVRAADALGVALHFVRVSN